MENLIQMEDFCKENNITITCRRIPKRPDGSEFSQDSFHFKVTLHRGEKKMDLFYFMGSGHGKSVWDNRKGKYVIVAPRPSVEKILDCLVSDSSSVDQALCFEEWAEELGYDPDSRKAESIYRACQKQASELRRVLGGKLFEDALYRVERL